MQSTWLIYALGGGLGHLTRASALARAAASEARIRILTNSPYAALVTRSMPQLDIAALDPALNLHEGRVEVLREISRAQAEVLVVDTFPRGLAGELAGILGPFDGAKVLVRRDLNPRYAEAYDLEHFVRTHYDLALNPGEFHESGPSRSEETITTAPWMVRSPQEILARERARELLRIADAKPCVIVCAAGNREELSWYGSVVRELLAASEALHVRCMAPECPPGCPRDLWMEHWPAMDFYAAGDVLIGGAGYNTIFESLACGIPLIARAWPRKYDRQQVRATRARGHGCVTLVRESGEAAKCAIVTVATKPSQSREPKYHNGAREAASLIRSAVLRKGSGSLASNFPGPHPLG